MLLKDLVDNSRTDKNTVHAYLDLYQKLLEDKKDTSKNILEVGIGGGGSIQLWNDFFLNADIYSIDITPMNWVFEKLLPLDRVTLYTGVDAYDEKIFNSFFNKKNLKFDMILDDGAHTLETMIKFIELYSKILTDDGILIIEDIPDMNWTEILKQHTPEYLKKFIDIYDLRNIKDRFDDIVFVIDKTKKNKELENNINTLFPNELAEIDKKKYLSSIGLMKALDDNKIINYINPWGISIDWNKLISNGKNGCCIYLKIANFMEFIENLDRIPFNFILITGDGDETMPYSIMDIDKFYEIINNNKIIKWYSVNCLENMHHKFSLIPIGLNYHCDALWHGVSLDIQENMLEKIRINSKPFNKRICLCYSNCHFSQYPQFGNPRQKAFDAIPPNLIFYEPNKITKEETYINQSKYSFVISPLGHGMDCHRTWEALILGCIVIVQTSPLDSLYKDLPVLIINEWSDITEELLRITIKKFETKTFLYDKLNLNYWINKIRYLN